jgi:hypothetical protein
LTPRHLETFSLLLFLGGIVAEGFFSEVIPGHGIGTSPASAADINIFTAAATSLIAFEIS